jgi:hypothetical protein
VILSPRPRLERAVEIPAGVSSHRVGFMWWRKKRRVAWLIFGNDECKVVFAPGENIMLSFTIPDSGKTFSVAGADAAGFAAPLFNGKWSISSSSFTLTPSADGNSCLVVGAPGTATLSWTGSSDSAGTIPLTAAPVSVTTVAGPAVTAVIGNPV